MEEGYLREFFAKFDGDGQLYENFLAALKSGDNKLFHNFVSEHFALDDEWIYKIEGGLFSIELIARNPRRFIKEEEDIVDVERAKRTNSKTVRHLSSHTQNIQAITKDNVRPKKVLVSEIDEDIAIYENRFVFALIERLSQFVEHRYQDIYDKAKNFDNTNLSMRSAFNLGKNEFECSLDIKVKEPSRDVEAGERLDELMGKIETIRKRLQVLKNTEFYKALSKTKLVKPPIQKTNLLRMNVDYRNCYQLWLFISAYTNVGYGVEVTEKNLPVEGDYFDDLTVVTALAVQSLVNDGVLHREDYDNIPAHKKLERDYKVVTSYKYVPDFGADKSKEQGEDAINEYYFRQMRNELVRATKKRTQIAEQKELDFNFSHFYKSIAKINGEMYKDVIKSEMPTLPKGRTELQKKEQAVKNQKVLLRRYAQLSRLQKSDFEKTLKMEKRELLKLEKLQKELDKAKKRRVDKIEADKKKKAKLKKIADRESQAIQSADAYERELRGLEAAKVAQKEEEQRQRREEAKRARELKKLQELKEKYDGEE